MNKTKKILFGTLALGCLCTSCNKTEGEGGEGSIHGIVYKIIDEGEIAKQGDQYVFVKDTIIAKDEDVFIKYGNTEFGYDDKTSTADNGTFLFKYLNDGNYTIYTLSDLASGDKEAISKTVLVNGGQTNAGQYYISDGKNNGKCGVVGTVFAQYEDASQPIPAFGVRVFIQKEGETTIEDVRTNENGMYAFPKLSPNSTYYVYAEHEAFKDEGIYASKIEIKTGEAGSIVSAEENIFVNIF